MSKHTCDNYSKLLISKILNRIGLFVFSFLAVLSISLSPSINLDYSNIDNSFKIENLKLKISKAKAAPNYQINYQGKLTNASNVAVPDGSYNIRFRLCTDSDCSAVIYTETHCYSPDSGTTCDGTGTDQRITLTNGLFSTMIGSVVSTLSSLNFNQTLYLGVTVGGSDATPSWDPEMSPRKTLGTVPSSFEAYHSLSSDTATTATNATNATNSDTLDTYHESSFAFLLGRSGSNQTLIGSTDANGTLTLQGTSNGSNTLTNANIQLNVGDSGSTTAMTILNNGNVGINTTSPDKKLDVLDTSSSQLRLSYADGTKFADFGVDTNHDLTIKPSSTGQIILQPTTDSTDFFQVLDSDGGTPVLNVDSTNERLGIGTATPSQQIHISNSSTDPAILLEAKGIDNTYNTSLTNPGTQANDSTVGTVDWTIGSESTFVSSGTQTSHYLKSTNYGFNIPSNATITGIEAQVEKMTMGGNDSYTKLLLHMDGTEGSTTFTDSSASAHAMTAQNSAHITTAQSKFGGASGAFAATGGGDYLTTPDSDDFYLNGDFTIDFWVRFSSISGSNYIFYQTDGSNFQGAYYTTSSNTWVFYNYSGGTYQTYFTASFTPSTNTWYHIAFVRSGTTNYFFADGQSKTVTTTNNNTPANIAASLSVSTSSAYPGLNGWFDEFRISKGIARWTANFTPPDAEYASGDVTDNAVRIVKSDGTIGTTDKSAVGNWPTTYATTTYGGAGELWGETWTPSDINDSDFGIALSSTGTDGTAYIDKSQIKVYYTIEDINWTLGNDYSNKGNFKIANSTALGTTDRLVINDYGNMGIGTASPTLYAGYTTLGINNTTTGGIIDFMTNDTVYSRIYGDNVSMGLNAVSAMPIIFNTTNTERMRIAADGKITIPDTYATTVGATNRDLYIDNTGLIGYVSSSSKYKDNITNMADVSWLYDLRPVNFTYKSDPTAKSQYGLIAEEVERVNPDFVSYDKNGNPETVSYSALVTPMLKSIQDQNLEIKMMRSKIDNITVINGTVNINKLTVKQSSTIEGNLIVDAQIAFNEDTVGQAKILACKNIDQTQCAKSVHVIFEKEYEYQPIVTITSVGKPKIQYQSVDNITTKGFDILIDTPQNEDSVFDWHAFASKDGKIFVSDGTTQNIEIKNGK